MNYVESINVALHEALKDSSVVLGGQLINYGCSGLTVGLKDKFPSQMVTFPVSESLMNSAAMGLALAGKRVVMLHERMDFLACGMDALVNHIPIWPRKCGVKLGITILAVVGKGHGQGPQHSKDFTGWFANFEGWNVRVPYSAKEAYTMMLDSIFLDDPVMYVAHRERFEEVDYRPSSIYNRIELCGAAERYEREFYNDR